MKDLQLITIGELELRGEAELQTGPFGTQLKASDYTSEGTPVINVRNIGFGNLREDHLEYLPDGKAAKLWQHHLKTGDIVFGRKGAVERHALIDIHANGWIQGSDCMRLRVKSNSVCEKYLSYYLRTAAHQDWMQALCSFGATMSSLNQDILRRLTFPAPILKTQKKIAAILSAYDDLIANNQRRITLLERMAEDIYREWFVRRRFPGHAQVKIEKGVPSGWVPSTLGQIADFTMGQSPSSEYFNESGIGLPFHQGVGSYGPRYPRHETFCSVSGRKARSGDILFSVRAPVGRLNIADRELIIGRGLAAIRHKQGFNGYLLYMLKVIFAAEDIIGNGSIFNSVGKDELARLDVYKPDINLIQKFEAFVGPVDKQIAVLYKANADLTATRDALLPRLISGKLGVDDLDIQFPPVMTTTQKVT